MKVKPFHWVIVADRLVFNYAARDSDSLVPVLDHIHLRIDIVVKMKSDSISFFYYQLCHMVYIWNH